MLNLSKVQRSRHTSKPENRCIRLIKMDATGIPPRFQKPQLKSHSPLNRQSEANKRAVGACVGIPWPKRGKETKTKRQREREGYSRHPVTNIPIQPCTSAEIFLSLQKTSFTGKKLHARKRWHLLFDVLMKYGGENLINPQPVMKKEGTHADYTFNVEAQPRLGPRFFSYFSRQLLCLPRVRGNATA